jgi:opacity protein-like surface antigen
MGISTGTALWRRSQQCWLPILQLLAPIFLLSLADMLPPFPTTMVRAEWYVGGYGGLSYPGAFSNVTVNDPALAGGVSGARLNDLELKSSLVGGVKAGYFFISRPWLGLETDVFTLKPDVKQQVVVGGTAGGRVFADTLQRIPLRLTTWAANLIIRSPSMSEVFQPYGGMGYALFVANSSQAGESNVHLSHGFNLFAGARYVLTPNWALFGEFKFNRSTLRFSEIRGNYDTQIFVFGLMWHFDK